MEGSAQQACAEQPSPTKELNVNSIRRINSDEPQIDSGTLKGVQIVIPAKNVGKTIEATLRYIAALGIGPDQVHVIVNGSTDNTRAVAEATGLATVIGQSDILSEYREELVSVYGISEDRLQGKGLAMFAGLLHLRQFDLGNHVPVVFLDGDIENIDAVNPVGRLITAWTEACKYRTPAIVKLASQGRQNEGIIAYLNSTRYADVAAFEWPLCGQVLLPWSVLRDMRMSTGYTVEMCMLIDILQRDDGINDFVETPLDTVLRDTNNSDHVHVKMYTRIFAFLRELERFVSDVSKMETEDIRRFNEDTMSGIDAWVPSANNDGVSSRTRLLLDALLPTITELGS